METKLTHKRWTGKGKTEEEKDLEAMTAHRDKQGRFTHGVKKGGRPRGSNDVGPLLRHNTLRALWLMKQERQAQHGRRFGMDELILEMIESVGPVEWFKMLSRYSPKTVDKQVTHDHTVRHTHESVSDTAEWIGEVLGRGSEDEAKEPLPN